MTTKLAIFILFSLFSSLSIAAKPTDDQVIKDVMKPGILDIQLTRGDGSYSVYRLQRMWEKGVTLKRDAKLKQYPKAKVIIGGVARYQIVGENYDYDTFKVIWNEYEGIPSPSDEEILKLVSDNLITFIGSYNWNKIVSKIKGPVLSKDPATRKVKWHTPKSFSIHLQTEFSAISSYTEVQDKKLNYEVRFYRDAVDKPWKKHFVSSRQNEQILTTHKYTSDEINAMPTLASIEAEKQAASMLASLPKVTIPTFANDKEALKFIYTNLLNTNKKHVEAMLRAMLGSSYYVQGSKVQLSQRGQETLTKMLSQIFDKKISFAKSYCPSMFVNHYQKQSVTFVDALKKRKSHISLSVEGGHYERGKKVGQQYKISNIEVWVLTSDDEIAQLKSWPLAELCAKNLSATTQPKQASASPVKSQPSSLSTTNNQPVALVQANVQTKPAKWVKFKSRRLPISMQVIGKAKEVRKKTGRTFTTTMVANTNKGTFQMSASDYKQKIPAAVASATHVKIAKSFVKSNAALIHKKKTIKRGVGNAIEALFERGSGNNKTLIAYQIFTHGSVIYQIMYSQKKAMFNKDIAKHYFDSIQLK